MNTPPKHPPKARARFGVLRYSSIELLGTLVLFFVTAPWVEAIPHGDLIEALMMSMLLTMAMLAVGGRKQTLIVCLVLLVPALCAKWFNHLHPHHVPAYVFSIFGLVFIAFVVTNLLRHIMRASHIDTEILCAAISAYLMLGLLWMVAYMMVARISPDAFSISGPGPPRVMTGFDAFYFSFVTLSTVGYGDITPVSKVARMLAVMEAVVGMFFVTLLIARLVTMYSPGGHHPPPSGDENP